MTSQDLQAALGTALAPVLSGLADLSAQVSSLDVKVTGLDAKVAGLDAKVTGLETRVAGLDAKVADLDVKVTRGFDRLDHRLALLESRVEDLSQHYALQARAIGRVEAEVADLLRKAPA